MSYNWCFLLFLQYPVHVVEINEAHTTTHCERRQMQAQYSLIFDTAENPTAQRLTAQ